MREYKKHKHKNLIILIPMGEENPSHGIVFEEEAEAHSYKLSLGLGTYPDPESQADCYQEYTNDLGLGHKLFEIRVTKEDLSDEPPRDQDLGCCQSGCAGCPWTIEQMKKGLL